MYLTKLLEKTDYTLVRGTLDREIASLVYDSRKVEEGSLFVCISGTKVDAHFFLADVARNGAAAVVIEKPWLELSEVIRRALVDAGVTVLQVKMARVALASLSATWFGYPMNKMTVVGVTGTKGKTTVTHMIVSILQAAGRNPGIIGTNGVKINGVHYDTTLTTPESYTLQYFAAKMLEEGVDSVVMEVSSSGLKFHRVDGISFDYGVFTNLSPDHIGGLEHPDFADYRASKALLFRRCKEGILNADDENYLAMIKDATCRIISFGADPADDYSLTEVKYEKRNDKLGCDVKVDGIHHLEFFADMPGLFNVYNAMAAAVTADRMGLPEEAITRGLADVRVDGRMEEVYANGDFSVIVDYAHNGLSARTLLETLRSYQPKRLVVVFGCGGNRDPHRRYEMGAAAGKYADLSIITEDNSRFEKAEDIIRDIHIGLDPTGAEYVDIPDRRQAIRYAISHAEKGDIIAVIGKGHEDYQEIEGVRHHFSDKEEILEAVKLLYGGN
ncbi:MAG: UDP-N-acetylmuramoyl-L-alanyl-D-glutamate--2,6-diaminopimelate ligase [Lachnospiraceae bacterium]|nr:UDP-N-acetylmuramoyl-L-alanyl-D-glutamate--2,6-diaminopimelate ligase [Lachnospiraceae bacterium]